MQKLLLASAMFFAVAGGAMAADPVIYETAPEAPVVYGFTWTGFYVGLHGGYAWTDVDFDDGGEEFSEDFDGGLLGAHAGYNWQFSPNFVGGVEVDIEHVWNEEDFEALGGEDFTAGTDWQGSARLRAGYAMDRTLFYVTGGVAFINAYVEAPDVGGLDEEETFVGWTAGVGVEHAFADNWTGRLEYRYADYGEESFDDIDVEIDQHSLRLGISYKF